MGATWHSRTPHDDGDGEAVNEQLEPAPQAPADDPATEATGHPVVDEVLRTMQGLQDRPVEEHVSVFEAAHEKLRAALADAGNPADGPRGS